MFGGRPSFLRCIIPIVLLLNAQTFLFAHKELVHQYLAVEAYRLLERRFPILSTSPFSTHIGTQDGDCSGLPFSTALITTGAYREDCEDPVYHYGDLIPFLDDAYFSASHFWDADAGERSTIEICDLTCGPFENAFQKSLRYIRPGTYGHWTARLSWPIGQAHFNLPGGGTTWIIQYGQIGFEYDDLAEFYRDGSCRITGYNDITGRWETASTLPDRLPIEIVAPQHVRDRIAWEVIGRMTHLLGDLGVPAHSHNDIHPPFWWNNEPADIFEEEMGGIYTAWDHLDAEEQGGILDLYDAVKTDDVERYMHYLYYTTSQVADRFPSNDADGDADFQTSRGEDDYSVLNIIDRIDVPTTDRDRFHREAADYSFVFSMRAIAGLYLWFATESGILNRVTLGTSFSGGHLLVDEKPHTSPTQLIRPRGVALRLYAPVQEYSDPSTLASYRMIFRGWTCELPSGEKMESTENPWETEPPYRSTITAEYTRELTISLTEPRNMDGGTGATYQVNGTDRGNSWSGFFTGEDDIPLTIGMSLPTGCVFLGWSDGSVENPRNITAADHLNFHGLYKYHLLTEMGSAGSHPAPRWIASTHATGYGENRFVIVYESGGNIFYSGSPDGTTWSDEELVNDGEGNSADPSIEYFRGTAEGISGTFIVWEEQMPGGRYSVKGRVKNAFDGRWGQIRDLSGSTSASMPGSSPVISSDVVLWRGPQGLLLRRFYDEEPVAVPGTDPESSEPALDVVPGINGEVTVAWRQAMVDIMFARGGSTTASWSGPFVVAEGSPGVEYSDPAIAVDGNGMVCIAWTRGDIGGRTPAYRYIDRGNSMRQVESVSDCPMPGDLMVVPSLTHYRNDENASRDLDIRYLDPRSGVITTLFIRSGERIGPVRTTANALRVSFPASGKKSAPGNLVIFPSGDGITLFPLGSVSMPHGESIPLTPTHLYPEPGAVISGSSVVLRWACAPDAAAHHLQVGTTDRFRTPLTVDLAEIAGNQFRIDGLLPGTRYYWRLASSNASGESVFSTPSMFETSPPPSAPVLTGTTVTLGTTRYPSLSWTIVAGATSYRVLRTICPGLVDCGTIRGPETVYRGSATTFIDRGIPIGSKLATARAWFSVVAEGSDFQTDPSNRVSYGLAGFMAWGNRPELPDDREMPAGTGLGFIYPNPFNPETRFRYQLRSGGHVTITVFNIIGETVTVLLDRDQEAGYYEQAWNASSQPPGVYIIELLASDDETGNVHRQQRKALYVK